MNNQQGPTVEHMELCAMLCGSLEGKGIGGEWIHVHVWLSPFTVHLRFSQRCESTRPQYKAKSFKKRCEVSLPCSIPIEMWD